MGSFDILGLGVVAVDDLIFVDAYPQPNTKTRVLHRERQCGGLTATALVAAARLGARCAYAGELGRDELSEYAIRSLKNEGINLDYMAQSEEARPAYSTIVIDEARKTRTIFVDLRKVVGAADQWPAEEIILSSRVLFVDHIGMRGMIRAARIARTAGIPVVADIENHASPMFSDLIELVDHLIVSWEFARLYTGLTQPEEAVEFLWAPGKSLVAVTCDEDGGWYKTAGSPARHYPAFQVNVVDTTGCGDVFHGAYAAGLVKGLPADECIRFASAAAALKATQRGGQAGAPTLAALEAFMKEER